MRVASENPRVAHDIPYGDHYILHATILSWEMLSLSLSVAKALRTILGDFFHSCGWTFWKRRTTPLELQKSTMLLRIPAQSIRHNNPLPNKPYSHHSELHGHPTQQAHQPHRIPKCSCPYLEPNCPSHLEPSNCYHDCFPTQTQT